MENTIKGYIEEAFTKPGNTNGKDWKRSAIKVNGKTLSTFDEHCANEIHEGKLKIGVPVEVIYETKEVNGKTYNTIVSIFPTEAKDMQPISSFQTADKVKTTPPKEVDWEGKERRIIRENVLARAVELFISDNYKNRDVDLPIREICEIAGELEEWIWKEKEKKEKKEKKEGEIHEETI